LAANWSRGKGVTAEGKELAEEPAAPLKGGGSPIRRERDG